MPFWDDFVDGLKDVGTSTTRIVTDTAIDIGDVATGFQFSDEMKKAKTKMSAAGVLSAADAIEKNHYSFLAEMEEDARRRVSAIEGLFEEGRAEEAALTRDAARLADMCADVASLAAESREAEARLAEARRIPGWERWATVLDLPPDGPEAVGTMSAAAREWERVGRDLTTAGLVVGTADGMAALAALGALSKARKLTTAAKLAGRAGGGGAKVGARVAGVMAKAGKFAKIGKLAGRASGVLAVVTVGLDVGLSVVELEARKTSLQTQLDDLEAGLAEARRDVADLRAERGAVVARMADLLSSVEPAQSRSGWDGWVEAARDALREAVRRLVSVAGIAERAERKARQTRGKPLALRAAHVAAVDPGISLEEARGIVERVDRADGASATAPEGAMLSALGWRIEGGPTHALSVGEGIDRLSLSYGFGQDDGPRRWVLGAEAPWSRTFELRWSVLGRHAPPTDPARLVLFADGPEGRSTATLFDGAPPDATRPAEGRATLQVHAGHAFGAIVSAAATVRDGVRELCATYARHPVENDWHVGVIDARDEAGTVLRWTNRAGVSWDLLPHRASDVLMKTPGSPYQDAHPGSNAFRVLREDGAVTGFEFMREVYAIDPATRAPAVGGRGLGTVTLDFLT